MVETTAMGRHREVRAGGLLIVVTVVLSACTGPSLEPTTTTNPTAIPSPPEETGIEGFAFPSDIDPGQRYLFYLHGKIIEDQGIPAISPEYGEYRYEDILRELASHGFVVISEVRPRDAQANEYARKVSDQIHRLLRAGTPSDAITVVGASKGATIAMLVSYLVADPDVNYVLLGGCNPPTLDELITEGVSVSGDVLSIFDSSDIVASSCAELFSSSAGKGLGDVAELVVHVGSGHGILYSPLPEWILPTVEWADSIR
jgi:hypothetical protein